jgi:hypothetical protein
MITIDEEIQNIIHFLSHQIDFTITIGHLSIGSVCGEEDCWIVTWKEDDAGMHLECQKDFSCLFDAVQYFVEKRRYLCLGSDFRELMNEEGASTITNVEVE